MAHWVLHQNLIPEACSESRLTCYTESRKQTFVKAIGFPVTGSLWVFLMCQWSKPDFLVAFLAQHVNWQCCKVWVLTLISKGNVFLVFTVQFHALSFSYQENFLACIAQLCPMAKIDALDLCSPWTKLCARSGYDSTTWVHFQVEEQKIPTMLPSHSSSIDNYVWESLL